MREELDLCRPMRGIHTVLDCSSLASSHSTRQVRPLENEKVQSINCAPPTGQRIPLHRRDRVQLLYQGCPKKEGRMTSRKVGNITWMFLDVRVCKCATKSGVKGLPRNEVPPFFYIRTWPLKSNHNETIWSLLAEACFSYESSCRRTKTSTSR